MTVYAADAEKNDSYVSLLVEGETKKKAILRIYWFGAARLMLLHTIVC